MTRERTVVHSRGILQTLAVCVLLALACRYAAALDSDRTITQFSHTAWGAKEDAPGTAQTPAVPSLQVGHDFWGFKENAPQGTLASAQTTDGFLWLGTPTGLYRFDGTRFELFHSAFGDQLLSMNVSGLHALPSGGLWIGYAFGGFSFLNNGRVTNYGGEISSLTGTVRGFAHCGDGTLWAATTSGLWKFDHSRWQSVGSEANVPTGPFLEVGCDREGTLWALSGDIIGPRKLLRRSRGSGQYQTIGNDLLVQGFTLDADGYVVISPESKPFVGMGSGDSGVRLAAYPVFRKGSSQIVDRANGVWIIPLEPVVLRADASGRLSDAVHKASPKNSQTYDLNPSFTAKLVDREGNIWFGDLKGIHRFFYSPLVTQELPKTATGLAFFTVAPADNGAVWIAAGNHSSLTNICYVANGRANLLPRSVGDLLGFAYRSPDKTLWLGGGGGLWRLVDGDLVRVDLPRDVADQAAFLQTITQDRRGNVWVSFGRHGLYRLADGVWTSYGGRDDLPKTGVVIEFTDSLGRVWFGSTNNTLAVLDGDRVQVFGSKDGLRVGTVTAIYGRGEKIWIGGEFGLQQFDHGRFHDIHASDSDLLRGISGIVETVNGDLWLNGLGGIFHIRRLEISEALKNPAYQVKADHFGTREGLPGFPYQLRPLTAAVEGTDGRIWFTTSGGVVSLDPAHYKKSVPAPSITIQSISADDKNYQLGAELKFPAHTSSVRISYSAISLSDPTAVRFRYRLKEADKDWREVASASSVSYRNLAPGSYHFSVAATDTNGVWSDKVAHLDFEIAPAWYQTNWFRLACVGVFLALLWGLYQLRLRQLRRQFNVRLEARVSERSRIAQDLHDTFFQGIQGLLLRFHTATSQLHKDEPARGIFEETLKQSDQVMLEGRELVLDLRATVSEQNDLPTAFADFGEGMRKGSSCEFKVVVNGAVRPLHTVVFEEVFKIGKEALGNAFRHSDGHSIEVELHYERSELRIHIRDDGTGIDSAILQQGHREGHFGLPGMRERAKKIGAHLDVWSGTEAGTEVELRIAARIAYVSEPNAPWLWKLRRVARHQTKG